MRVLCTCCHANQAQAGNQIKIFTSTASPEEAVAAQLVLLLFQLPEGYFSLGSHGFVGSCLSPDVLIFLELTGCMNGEGSPV